MITINLKGFGDGYPDTVKLEAKTYREALEGLKLHPQFNPAKSGFKFLCEVEGVTSTLDLEQHIKGDTIVVKCQQKVPRKELAGAGSSSNGWVKIVIGIILLVVAFYTWDPSAAEGSMAAFASAMAPNLAMMGVALIAGGLAIEMAENLDSEDDRKSNSAGRYPNTIQPGTPIALILGRHRWGGQLFSFNLDTAKGSTARIVNFTGLIWDPNDYNGWDSWETLYFETEQRNFAWSRYMYEGIEGGPATGTGGARERVGNLY